MENTNKSNFWNNIFSIKNESVRKVITILGIKFKFLSKKLIIRKKIVDLENKCKQLEDTLAQKTDISTNLIQLLVQNIPIQNNKIVFNNFIGNGYGCNPKYIAEEIISQNLPYELVWLVKNAEKQKGNFPKEIKLVEFNIPNAIKELASAKVWVSNQRMPELYENGLYKKPEQYYIQTWHGSLGIKKCEKSVEHEKPWWCKWAKVDASFIDCMITNSEFEQNLFKQDFWYDKYFLQCGHARNDIFFQSEDIIQTYKHKILSDLQIPLDKKIILYVPTFRNNEDAENYLSELETLKPYFDEKFGSDFVFFVRLHPITSQDILNSFGFNKNVYNLTNYNDIQELLVSADILISDYSSCIYDFMLSYKPAFIYAKDKDKYNTDTGFYYPLETTPFPIAVDVKTFINNIKSFDNKKYNDDVKTFLDEKQCIENGNASKNIVDLIKNNI